MEKAHTQLYNVVAIRRNVTKEDMYNAVNMLNRDHTEYTKYTHSDGIYNREKGIV